jgi:hypothetical protein
MELQAAFDGGTVLEVGERAVLRVAVRNLAERCSDEGILVIEAPRDALMLAATEMQRCIPPLSPGERFENIFDAYATRAQEFSIVARLLCGGQTFETRIAVTAQAHAAFAVDANRLEFSTHEAPPGSAIEGRIVLTNTGRGPATIDAVVCEGDLEECVLGEHRGTLAAGERRFVAVRGRVPHALADGTTVTVGATVVADGAAYDLGRHAVVVRAREAHVWRVRLVNGSASPAIIEPGGEVTLLIEPASAPSVPVRSSALDAASARYIESLPGLMRHLWALGALCAEGSSDELRSALRSVFDRLSIKVRMPYYPIAPDDVVDANAAGALRRIGAPSQANLGTALAFAASCIAPLHGTAQTQPYEIYRDALAGQLRELDDAALIDALTGEQPALDDALRAVLAIECAPVAA